MYLQEANMLKEKPEKKLLQIKISDEIYENILEYKKQNYSYMSMSAFFVDTVLRKIEEDKKK